MYIGITVLNSSYFQKLLSLWLVNITSAKNKTEEKILKIIIVVITVAPMIARQQNFFPANAVLI